MGKILIAISGPKHGGKTTLAKNISHNLVSLGYDQVRLEFSDVLEDMLKPLRIQGGKEARRPYLIAVGEALEKMEGIESPLTSGVIAHLLRYSSTAQIISGVGRESEFFALREYAHMSQRHFLHIHQSMYAKDETNQTPTGEQYPDDCRVNLMEFAHLWNPQDTLIERKLAEFLSMDYGESPF